MKKSEVTREQFAEWSFERDMDNELYDDYPHIKEFSDLSEDEQIEYLAEADMYLQDENDRLRWPVDILERLEM